MIQAICTGHLPHRIVENPAFNRFVSILNPNYKLPTRRSITEKFVPETYNAIKVVVEDSIRKTNFVSLSTDGWTDVRKNAIVNVVVHLPTPLLLKSVDTGLNSHSGMF